MLLNFKSSLKKGLATIATIASIFASLSVGLNNTVQFLHRVEPHIPSGSSQPPESELQSSQKLYSFKDP